MPTFTLIISDNPFTRDSIGEAPFLETIEQGASNSITTPATEAYKRCLDAVTESKTSPTKDENDEIISSNLEWEISFNRLYDTAKQLYESIEASTSDLQQYVANITSQLHNAQSNDLDLILTNLKSALFAARTQI